MVGTCWGGPIAIEYAARHPEQVTHLVLYGTYARGTQRRGNSPNAEARARVMSDLTRLGWAQEDHAFLQLWASRFQPGGTLDHRRSWCEPMRAATCADTAIRLFQIAGDIDVREAARKIKCPVLIVHPERDVNVPIEEARLLASLIPHCRFVQLDTENHMPLADEPAWEQFVAEVRSFLARAGGGLPRATNACRSVTLTPRERAVLEGIAEGLDNAEIAGIASPLGENRPQPYYPDLRQDLRRASLSSHRACPRSGPRESQQARQRGADTGHLSLVPRPAPVPTPGHRPQYNCLRPALESEGRASHALARMPREARRRGRGPRGKRNTIRSAQADPLRRRLPNKRRTSCMPIFAAHSWPQL